VPKGIVGAGPGGPALTASISFIHHKRQLFFSRKL